MIRRLLHYCSPRARRLVIAELSFVVVAAIFQGIAFLLLVPLLRSLFLGDLDASWGWLIAVVGAAVGYVVASWFASQIGMEASTAVLDSLLERLGDSVVSLPVSWFSTDRTGLVTGLATQGAMFVSTMPYAILRQMPGRFHRARDRSGRDVLLRLAASARDDGDGADHCNRLPLASQRIGRGDQAHTVAVAEASNRVVEFARAQPALRTAGEGSIADRLVDEALENQHQEYRGLLITGGAGIAIFAGLVQLSITVLLVTGAFLAIGGIVDIATLIALLVLGVRFNEPIVAAGDLGGGIAVARTTIDRLDEFAAIPRLSEPEHPAAPAGFGVEFQGVTFGYGGDAVLRDLFLHRPGGRDHRDRRPVGLGQDDDHQAHRALLRPRGGDGAHRRRARAQARHGRRGGRALPVFQDVYLFDDTILNNVWIGNPDLSRDEVIAAATRARVDEIVERLPGGWDARVGEGGSNLSRGERQRVSIARALLKDAPIVLLDEATSALDIGNEIAIGEAIDGVRAGRTLIVVAHRLQTIMTADRIIMLDGSGGIRHSAAATPSCSPPMAPMPATGMSVSTPLAGSSPTSD